MSTNGTRKPEYRSYQLTINIEPSLVSLIQPILETENMSASDYGRILIMWDLVERNLITREDIVRICIGSRVANGTNKGVRLATTG
jgi:hypothetical protein